MSTKFTLSWIGPRIERDIETTRYATFLQNTLGRVQSDLQVDEVRLTDTPEGRRRIEADITLTVTDATLDRVQEWLVERLAALPDNLPGLIMVLPPKAQAVEGEI